MKLDPNVSVRVNKHDIVILRHGAIHSCKSASVKDNTLRFTLHNNWETHVKITSKEKQSWHCQMIETEGAFDHPQTERQGGASLRECDDLIELEELGRGRSGGLEVSNSHGTDYAITENSNNKKQTELRGSFDHPHNMRQGEAPLGDCEDFIELEGASRGGGENLESDSSHGAGCAITEKTNNKKHTKPRGSFDHPHTMRQGGAPLGGCDAFIRLEGASRGGGGNPESGSSHKTNYAITGNSDNKRQTLPRGNSDHPHTRRQGGGAEAIAMISKRLMVCARIQAQNTELGASAQINTRSQGRKADLSVQTHGASLTIHTPRGKGGLP